MGAGRGGGNNRDDVLVSGGASTVLKGGRGNDTYVIDTPDVHIDEKNNGGIDQVLASVDHNLDANVENLTLTGEDNLAGAGNDLDNLITGNTGDNTISGGAGSDRLDGGEGQDTAIFDGVFEDYLIEADGAWLFVTGPDGDTDMLTNFEYLLFGEQLVDLYATEDPAAVTAVDDLYRVQEDGQVTFDVLGNDTGGTLSIREVSDGQFGRVIVNADNTLTYIPDPDAHGTDVFSYSVMDEHGQVASGNVTIDVAPVNDAPIATGENFLMADGSAAFQSPGSVLDNDNDKDGDTLAILSCDSQSENGGQIDMRPDGSFTFVPASGFVGSDRFSYTVTDGQGGTQAAWVDIVVEAPPEEAPPEATPPEPEETPYYVDTLMAGDWYRLNANEDYGTGATVTFAFAEAPPEYYDADHWAYDDFRSFGAEQMSNTIQALDMIETYCGLTFVQTSVEDAEIVFGFADVGASGFAYWPTFDGIGETASDVWLDTSLAAFDLDSGTEAYKTLVHEIGHALGMTHPALPEAEETRAYTLMADTAHPGMHGEEPTTFQQYDIATLQHLYGANTDHASGDDTYDLGMLEGQIQTLWDGGGHDTLDLSAASYEVDLDLRQGAFSTVDATGRDNLAIAHGTWIEDAIGGDHDDRLVGNELDNQLTGGGGSDVFGFGDGFGHDTITDFSKGEDLLDLAETELSFADLEITRQEDGLLINHGSNSILLLGMEEEIDETDFVLF